MQKVKDDEEKDEADLTDSVGSDHSEESEVLSPPTTFFRKGTTKVED